MMKDSTFVVVTIRAREALYNGKSLKKYKQTKYILNLGLYFS